MIERRNKLKADRLKIVRNHNRICSHYATGAFNVAINLTKLFVDEAKEDNNNDK